MESNGFVGLWAECKDGTIGQISEIDKRGYCVLRDRDGQIVKRHEPLSKLKTEEEDKGVYLAGALGGETEACWQLTRSLYPRSPKTGRFYTRYIFLAPSTTKLSKLW